MKKTLTYTLLAAGIFALAGIGIVSADGGIDAFKVRSQQMLEKGIITQEQIDEKMARMETHHANMFEERASVLGLSAEELKAELAEDKTCPEIAGEQGIDPEELRQQMGELKLEHLQNRLDQMVTDGKITQEQADEKMANIKEQPKGEPSRLGNFHGKGGKFNR
ncbi:hypothetical protein KAR26_04070 [Candidatus Parcubacteria bacterium]|nr:hypothetical protein [Candidatus Parcubacteria bacterium]